MTSPIDSQPLQITCSGCGKDFFKAVGDVKRDGQAICPRCGHTVKLDEAGEKTIVSAEQELVDLEAKARSVFENLFKSGR
ncbi:hypothetical protein SAMN04244572_04360 [Azotobacter beijerinckii]|uniref:MJ0042 family finger-like domain-containing protein n=1 Tax=Azotobacter beijerinckii TaxID=170623 RepID=A0A1H6ZK14_9GAMM|nr:hypothetical protein SAMN04244572_04360 [Azotobacter beijerinckii]